jgi:hypothetical protein
VRITSDHHTLSYYAKIYTGYDADNYEVHLSTASNITSSADFNVVLKSRTTPSDSYEHITIDLSAYIGQDVYIAFRHLCDDPDNGYALFLDDVSGLEVVSCPDIDNCVVVVVGDIIDAGNGDFESSDHTVLPPQGWKVFIDGDAGSPGWEWREDAASAHSGTGFIGAYSYRSGVGYISDNWLVTPKVRISSSHHTLSFWVRDWNNVYPDAYEVHLSTASDVTSSSDFDVKIKDLTVPSNSYEQVTIDLSAYIGQDVYIAFRHISDEPDGNYALYLDDVSGLDVISCSDASAPGNTTTPIMGFDDLSKCGDYSTGQSFVSNGYNVDGFKAAVKFSEADIDGYSCSKLNAITIAMYNPLDIELFVQRGDDVIYTKSVSASEIPAQTPVTIMLDSLVSFEGEGDLYIGYITPAYSSGTSPYGIDAGPNVAGGAEVYFGGQWISVTNANNFYIIGHTELTGAIGTFSLYRQHNVRGVPDGDPELIAQELETDSYLDKNLSGGEYCYWLTFNSRELESCSSDTICVFLPYTQTIKAIDDIEKIYGDDDFKIDKAGTDGIVLETTADAEDYFTGFTVPVKLNIISGNSIELTGSESDYNVKILTAGVTRLQAVQEGITGAIDTLLPATPVEFDITVLKRDLYISVDNQTKQRGVNFDPLTLHYNRFYNGDDESDLDDPAPVATCSATPSSPAGDYTIVIHVSLDNNYELIPENGVLHLLDSDKAVNSFTPHDKDLLNDAFMPGYRIKVFNRFGVLIYETKNAQEKEHGWNGRFQDTETLVNPGVYYYILYDDNGKEVRKGSVNVVKK